MKVIVAGSRSITSYPVVALAIFLSGFEITEVVSGGARGVDTLGEQWALCNFRRLSCIPADWDQFGKRAGYMRNAKMAEYADALIAVWDGQSRGTKSMMQLATGRGLKVYVHRLP